MDCNLHGHGPYVIVGLPSVHFLISSVGPAKIGVPRIRLTWVMAAPSTGVRGLAGRALQMCAPPEVACRSLSRAEAGKTHL